MVGLVADLPQRVAFWLCCDWCSASVNMQNTAGWTPVHAAAAGNSLKALKTLLRAGADLELRDRGVRTLV